MFLLDEAQAVRLLVAPLPVPLSRLQPPLPDVAVVDVALLFPEHLGVVGRWQGRLPTLPAACLRFFYSQSLVPPPGPGASLLCLLRLPHLGGSASFWDLLLR